MNLNNLTEFTNWQVSSTFSSKLFYTTTLLLIICEKAAMQQKTGNCSQ